MGFSVLLSNLDSDAISCRAHIQTPEVEENVHELYVLCGISRSKLTYWRISLLCERACPVPFVDEFGRVTRKCRSTLSRFEATEAGTPYLLNRHQYSVGFGTNFVAQVASKEIADNIEITDSKHRNLHFCLLTSYNGGFFPIDQRLIVPIEISDALASSV